jgi:hypothetical protein
MSLSIESRDRWYGARRKLMRENILFSLSCLSACVEFVRSIYVFITSTSVALPLR